MISAILRKGLERAAGQTELPFRVVFADGSSYRNRDDEPRATIVFRRRWAEWSVLLFGEFGLTESYLDQTVDVEGDLAAILALGMGGELTGPSPLVAILNWWHEVRFGNRSLAQAKANARFRYGLGSEFYRHWLDRPGMMYTCAYWKEGTRTIEEAQWNKNDHVCRKLRLRPGDTMADIGCGWGGLMFHAHEHYGAVATGYNVATEQVAELREEIGRRGLDQLTVHEKDFREVEGPFDKVASIGVLEHAGKHQLGAAIKSLADCLRPGGIGVLHTIGRIGRVSTGFFIRKHVFPGAWIPSLLEILDLMERNGLEVIDVENLRRHYAVTLDAWVERFEENWDAIRRLDPERFDEHFRREWRVYLMGCAEMFRSPNEKTHLFQVTFSKGYVGFDYPMSRAHLYEAAAGGDANVGA